MNEDIDNDKDYQIMELKQRISYYEPYKQKYEDLKEDWKYIKSLLDKEFNKRTRLKKENEQLKEENKKLIEEWEFSFRTEMAHHRFAEKELQEKIREKQATINKLKEENEQLKKARDESDKFIAKKGLGAEFLNWCVAND